MDTNGIVNAIRISEYEEFGSKGSTSNASTGSQPSQEGSNDKLTQMLSLRNDWMINYDELMYNDDVTMISFCLGWRKRLELVLLVKYSEDLGEEFL